MPGLWDTFVSRSGTTHLTTNRHDAICGQADVPDAYDDDDFDTVNRDGVRYLADGSVQFCGNCRRLAGVGR